MAIHQRNGRNQEQHQRESIHCRLPTRQRRTNDSANADNRTERFATALQKRRIVLFRMEHRECRRAHPQNCHLVQQLSDQAERCMEIRRTEAHNDQQRPNHVDARIDEVAIVPEQMHQQRRQQQEQDVAKLFAERCEHKTMRKNFVKSVLQSLTVFTNSAMLGEMS